MAIGYNCPMRVTIAPEHQKFFQMNGYISFEELLPEEERKALLKEVAAIHKESPHYDQKDLFRSVISLLPLLKKYSLATIGAKLLDKKPLRIASDQLFPEAPLPPHIPENSIALLLSMETGEGVFFRGELPELYKGVKGCYFLFVFTANYTSNPVVSS